MWKVVKKIEKTLKIALKSPKSPHFFHFSEWKSFWNRLVDVWLYIARYPDRYTENVHILWSFNHFLLICLFVCQHKEVAQSYLIAKISAIYQKWIFEKDIGLFSVIHIRNTEFPPSWSRFLSVLRRCKPHNG